MFIKNNVISVSRPNIMPYVKKKKKDEDFLPGKSRRSGYFKKELDDRGNKREMVKLLGK